MVGAKLWSLGTRTLIYYYYGLYFVISLLLVQKNLIGLQCSIPVVVNSIGIDQKATIMKTVITPYLSVLILPVKQKVTGNNKIKISEKRKKKKT